MDDFSKYQHLKDIGEKAQRVFDIAIGDGLDRITAIRMLRHVFDLDLIGAKEVLARAEWAERLDELQAGLVEALEEALRSVEDKSE
jgi:hypothetical protein